MAAKAEEKKAADATKPAEEKKAADATKPAEEKKAVDAKMPAAAEEKKEEPKSCVEEAKKADLKGVDSYLVKATMEVNKPSDCDAGMCGAVKSMALKDLADNLKAKIAAE